MGPQPHTSKGIVKDLNIIMETLLQEFDDLEWGQK